jgi:hypothetical protein
VSINYEVEERSDGFWMRFLNEDGSPRELWIGPYPTREKADAEVKASIEAMLALFVKTTLGLK